MGCKLIVEHCSTHVYMMDGTAAPYVIFSVCHNDPLSVPGFCQHAVNEVMIASGPGPEVPSSHFRQAS